MRLSRSIPLLAIVLAASLMSVGFAQTAGASVISTEVAIDLHERNARIERINSVLARDNVQQQLAALGVDPAAAQERVATLSDSELELLQQRMDTLPAGADSALAVLGIVLLVLLVLELVGVTDVFKSF
ncbi:MAG: PA2779 family protein [Woeseia sp.]